MNASMCANTGREDPTHKGRHSVMTSNRPSSCCITSSCHLPNQKKKEKVETAPKGKACMTCSARLPTPSPASHSFSPAPPAKRRESDSGRLRRPSQRAAALQSRQAGCCAQNILHCARCCSSRARGSGDAPVRTLCKEAWRRGTSSSPRSPPPLDPFPKGPLARPVTPPGE